jgi:hypothetical protein
MVWGSIPLKFTFYSKYACTNCRTVRSSDDLQYTSFDRQALCQSCVYFVDVVFCNTILPWHLTSFSVDQLMHEAALPSFSEGGVSERGLSIRHSPALSAVTAASALRFDTHSPLRPAAIHDRSVLVVSLCFESKEPYAMRR